MRYNSTARATQRAEQRLLEPRRMHAIEHCLQRERLLTLCLGAAHECARFALTWAAAIQQPGNYSLYSSPRHRGARRKPHGAGGKRLSEEA
jgi:hypothetical protein